MTGDSHIQPGTELVQDLRMDADMLRDGYQKNLTELWHSEVVREAAKNALRAAAEIERLHAALPAERPAVAQASDTSLPESLVRSLRDHLQQSDSFLWLDEIQTLDAALASSEKIRGILARVCTCGVASYLSVHDAGCPLSSTVREGGK